MRRDEMSVQGEKKTYVNREMNVMNGFDVQLVFEKFWYLRALPL